MLIAYLTTDELNKDRALELAEEYGITLYPLASTEVPLEGLFDALLYDWDCLLFSQRQEILLDSLTALPSCPVAVHGYDLDDDEAESLHQDGVAVFDRLEPEVFRTLRRLARPKMRLVRSNHQRLRALALSAY